MAPPPAMIVAVASAWGWYLLGSVCRLRGGLAGPSQHASHYRTSWGIQAYDFQRWSRIAARQIDGDALSILVVCKCFNVSQCFERRMPCGSICIDSWNWHVQQKSFVNQTAMSPIHIMQYGRLVYVTAWAVLCKTHTSILLVTHLHLHRSS